MNEQEQAGFMKRLGRAWNEIMGEAEKQRIRRIWRGAQEGTLTDQEELRLAKILKDHTEFHQYWSEPVHRSQPLRDQDINPFLHVSLHLIIENQIAQGRPSRAEQLYNREIERGIPRHKVIHHLAGVFSEVLYDTLRRRKPFDQARYLARLQEETSQIG